MSDQGRWWKFYTTAPTDPHLQLLDRGDRWSWAALGAYIKVHGEKGVLNSPLTNIILAAFLGVPPEHMIETIKRIANVCKNIVYEEGKNRHGEFTVTWQKWVSFQEDTTMAKRQQTSRIKRRGEEKRGEEKKEVIIQPPSAPENGFSSWPPDWAPILDKIHTIPILTTYKHWLSDLDWWKTMDELFTSCPKRLDALLLEAAAYIKTEDYRPRTKKALRMKLRNCMEFSARRAEREGQGRVH